MSGGALAGARRRAGCGMNVSATVVSGRTRPRPGLRDQRLVAEVNAVEVADGDGRPRRAGRPRGRKSRGPAEDLHEPPPGAVFSGSSIPPTRSTSASSSNGFSRIRPWATPKRRAAVPRHAGHQRDRHAREDRRQLLRQKRRVARSRNHEVAQHGARGGCAFAPGARRVDVANQHGRVPGLAQNLRHESRDARVVLDHQDDGARSSFIHRGRVRFRLTSPSPTDKNSGPS